MNRSLAASMIIALAALLSRCSTGDTGSQTHWFGTCAHDGDCDAGASCLCGVCTRSCTMAGDCDALSRGAACVVASSPAHRAQCGDGSGAICLPSCASGCALGARCIDGVCVAGQESERDASVATGGRGGAGGSSSGGAAPSSGGDAASTGGRSSTGGVAGSSTGGSAGSAAGGSGTGASDAGSSPDSAVCPIIGRDPLGDPFCGGGYAAVSGTVTAISQVATCGSSGVPGYVITVQPAGMPATNVPLALGDLPQPFEVGDHFELLTEKPTFQAWLTHDLRKNGVTVVYTTYLPGPKLLPPLTLEFGADLCTMNDFCVISTLHSLHATAGGVTVDIPPGGHADVGDFRVFNIYVASGVIVPGTNCQDVVAGQFEVAAVRRTPVGAVDDAGAPDAH